MGKEGENKKNENQRCPFPIFACFVICTQIEKEIYFLGNQTKRYFDIIRLFYWFSVLLEPESLPCRSLKEVLPPALDSTSEPPPLFDGTTWSDLEFQHLDSYFFSLPVCTIPVC